MLLRESLKGRIKFYFQVGQTKVGLSVSQWFGRDAESDAVPCLSLHGT